jgi:RimJ/RimL family protein N-acetyltransferase
VYVQAKHQGKGLGTKLFDAVFAHATPLVKQIHLGVGTKNLPALKLYEKLGFEIYGTEPRALCINGQYIDEHLMVKFLDQEEKI